MVLVYIWLGFESAEAIAFIFWRVWRRGLQKSGRDQGKLRADGFFPTLVSPEHRILLAAARIFWLSGVGSKLLRVYARQMLGIFRSPS